MVLPFFAVGVAAIGVVVGVQAAPFFEEGTRYARGGGLQIPIVNGLLSTFCLSKVEVILGPSLEDRLWQLYGTSAFA